MGGQSPVCYALDQETSTLSFKSLDPHTPEVVLCAHYNYYGTRLVLGCADHRLRVYDKDSEGAFNVADTWRGHDGEVLDIKWKGGTTSQIIGSVGQDLKLKVWQEDSRHGKNTGRLFKNVFSVSSGNLVIYTSLDFRVMGNDTLMAAVTRDGLLTCYEPVKAEAFDEWKDVDQFWVNGEPLPRGMETSFKVSFQQHNGPTSSVLATGLPHSTISCAIASMENVKLFRVVRNGMSYQFQPYFAELKGGQGLIRDLAWCPIAWLDHEIVAVSKGDGCIRFYTIFSRETSDLEDSKSLSTSSLAILPAKRNMASGITAGLAGVSLGPESRSSREVGLVTHSVVLTEEVSHDGVWPIKWIPNSKTLVSVGGQSNLKIWKKSIDGKWKEFAESEFEE